MSIISSLNIAQQALAVNQAAITVVSNNIANVDTEGYSKLRVDLGTVINNTPSAGNKISVAESCSGVTINSVKRYSDTYLQNYYRQENTTYSYLKQYSQMGSNIQDLVNELNGTGLEQALTNFYTAANTLSGDPSDITARSNYVQSASNVAAVFNNTANDLNNLKRSLIGDPSIAGSLESSAISSSITDVNSLLDQLAKVNFDIIKTNSSSASENSALLDKRDTLLKQLSSAMPIAVSEQPNGTVNVSLGDYNLVSGAVVKGYLAVDPSGNPSNPVTISIVDAHGTQLVSNVNSDINSGSIGAILDICGSNSNNLTISGVLKNLDTMANNFSTVLNQIQTGDPNGDGTTAMAIDKVTKKLTVANQAMYQTSDGTPVITASNITVNPNIIGDPYLVAAARVVNPADISAVGNNSNMTLVLNSRTKSYGGLGDTTFESYLSGLVSQVGSQVKNINTNLEDQTSVINQVESNLKSKIGVNLDEELVDLVKYQRAYQASARVFSVCNSLLDELVNLGK